MYSAVSAVICNVRKRSLLKGEKYNSLGLVKCLEM